jgi:glycosyltransferase involved in cell wall biosynthesis
MTTNSGNSVPLERRPVLVMGNGPSARLLDFDRIGRRRFASVGMNAAYRYWDRINFRPTYYICMDVVVIRSHAQRIAELIDEGLIEEFFLRNEFLQDHPRFAEHPRITWFDTERARQGSLFDTHWVTTGSWAIRWMASLGHPLIVTIGIDSNYVELLAEAKRLGEGNDLRLELTRTPTFNPNYFFSGYQQAGDLYNVPNDPTYLKKTGGLVHIDALRRTRQDIERLQLPVRVVDGSPLSQHGVFSKVDIDRVFSAQQIGLVTSFFAAAPEDEVTNNIRIALGNCGNPDIGRVLVLFEGRLDVLRSRISQDLMREVEAAEASGRLQFRHIETRPDYLELFEAARGLGFETCAVTNADVMLDAPSTSVFLADYQSSTRSFIALTRWNRTANGLFIQGQVAHPPWQEVPIEELTYRQVNHLSFDAYLFDRRTPLPAELRQVRIGTFGCDTTIAALMRIAGQQVCNPCLRHRVVHIDEKVRDYSSEKGTAQMLANTDAVRKAFLARLPGTDGMADRLGAIESLRPSKSSIGTPMHRLGRWHSIARMLGASPWVHSISEGCVDWEKISFSNRDVAERPASVIDQLVAGMAANRFLEIEVQGQNGDHFLGSFGSTPELQETREKLFRYDRQSVIWVDLVTDEERRIHADALLAVRQVLTMGTGALDSVPGSGSLPGGPWKQAETGPIVVDPPLTGRRQPDERSAGSPVLAGGSHFVGHSRRLLLIDPTVVDHGSATGQVKAQFLGAWPRDRLLQIHEESGPTGGLRAMEFGRQQARPAVVDEASLLELCVSFAPDVIYCRPVDSPRLLSFALRVVTTLTAPLVVHVMDDWPERARLTTSEEHHSRVDSLLRRLLLRASARLAISEPMSRAFGQRYSGDWAVLANGVDVEDYPVKNWDDRPLISAEHPFVVRYMGGLAPDMGDVSVADIAQVVGSLQSTHSVRLEVYTMPWYQTMAQATIGKIPGVSIHPLVDKASYRKTLSEADALIIAYNFDDLSMAYCGLSMANKLPECLATGVPILAYGPARSATIDQLLEAGCAEVVQVRSGVLIRESLLRLMNDPGHAKSLGLRGRQWVAEHRSLSGVQQRFASIIETAAALPPRFPVDEPVAVVGDIEILAPHGAMAHGSISARVPGHASGRTLLVLIEVSGNPRTAATLSLRWSGEGRTDSSRAWVSSPFAASAWMLLESPVPVGGGDVRIDLRQDDSEKDLDVESGLLALVDGECIDVSRGPEGSLQAANAHFRAGAFEDALAVYLQLLRRSPHPMFAFNAHLCGRKLGRIAATRAPVE